MRVCLPVVRMLAVAVALTACAHIRRGSTSNNKRNALSNLSNVARARVVVATCSNGLAAHCNVSLHVACVSAWQGLAGRVPLASRCAALGTSGHSRNCTAMVSLGVHAECTRVRVRLYVCIYACV